MGTIWKVVLTFGIIIMITVTGITMTTINVEITTAGNYLEEMCAVIRESNYNSDIIAECMAEAEANGYTLKVQVFQAADGYRYRDGGGYAKVRLGYRYQYGLLQGSGWKFKEKII